MRHSLIHTYCHHELVPYWLYWTTNEVVCDPDIPPEVAVTAIGYEPGAMFVVTCQLHATCPVLSANPLLETGPHV